MFEFFLNLLYSVSLNLGYGIAHIISLFNDRIKRWLTRQKNWRTILDNYIANENTIWIHGASVGELQMAIPLIDSIRKISPKSKIVLSFFSASMYDFIHQFESKVDVLFQYPMDSRKNVSYIIDKINPKTLVIIKNDMWYNLIKISNESDIKIYLVECKKNNFKYNNIYYKYIYNFVNKKYYQENGSLKIEYLVSNRQLIKKDIEVIQNYVEANFTIILGSCYLDEVKWISKYYKYNSKNLKIIFVPHEFDAETISIYQKYFDEKIGLYSNSEFNYNLLFVDQYGILKNIYQYANLAIVGGGLRYKLHNAFEPLLHNVPALIGNKFKQDEILNHAIEKNLIVTFCSENDLYDNIEYFKKNKSFNFENEISDFFLHHKNVSETICEEIFSSII